jgi:hypothetical protein
LTAQLLEHLCRSCKPVTRLADGDVEDEFLDAELAHRVGGLVGGALGLDVLAIGLLTGGLAFGLDISRISISSSSIPASSKTQKLLAYSSDRFEGFGTYHCAGEVLTSWRWPLM